MGLFQSHEFHLDFNNQLLSICSGAEVSEDGGILVGLQRYVDTVSDGANQKNEPMEIPFLVGHI